MAAAAGTEASRRAARVACPAAAMLAAGSTDHTPQAAVAMAAAARAAVAVAAAARAAAALAADATEAAATAEGASEGAATAMAAEAAAASAVAATAPACSEAAASAAAARVAAAPAAAATAVAVTAARATADSARLTGATARPPRRRRPGSGAGRSGAQATARMAAVGMDSDQRGGFHPTGLDYLWVCQCVQYHPVCSSISFESWLREFSHHRTLREARFLSPHRRYRKAP